MFSLYPPHHIILAQLSISSLWSSQGHVDAAYNLAHLLLHGAGVDPDDGQAVWWFTKAAEQVAKINE